MNHPQLVQLMDDDIVSLAGLAVLANRDRHRLEMTQLCLSLHLTTQSQIQLRHSTASLSPTLDYVRLARFYFKLRLAVGIVKHDDPREDDLIVLKFVEQKILRYMSVGQ